jgi:cytoskeleton protein RodZ
MHASENPPLEQSSPQAGGEGSDPQAGEPAPADLVAATDRATDAAASDVAAETLSAGALLTSARERIGLTVSEVANHLKLSVRQVEALEADAFERLPSPMFVRGFARSYARLVQIDPRPVMLALDIRFPPPAAGAVMPAPAAPGLVRQPAPSAIPFPSSDRPSRWLHSAAALLAAVVIGFLTFEWYGPLPAVPVLRPDAGSAAPREALPSGMVPVVPLSIGAGTAGAAPDASTGQMTPSPDGTVSLMAVPPQMGSPATPVGASSTAASEIGDAFGTGARTVRLSFDRESWVEIRDARGRLIFSQLNPPGSSQEVRGDPPLSLVIGNARSVRLAYGGREIDLAPYTRVDVARFTLD